MGYQAQAYGGPDDGLFRAIIAESMWEYPEASNISFNDKQYANITATTGCNSSSDSLDCLRHLPFETLSQALNVKPAYSFGPIVDGDFVLDLTSKMLRTGRFAKFPLLIGSNTDEGTTFGPRGINSDAEFAQYVSSVGPDVNTTIILEELYPDIPAIGIPETLHIRPNRTYGLQYKRSSAFAGDYMILAPRRAHNQAWSNYNVTSYAFRFNVLVSGGSWSHPSSRWRPSADSFQCLSMAVPTISKKLPLSWITYMVSAMERILPILSTLLPASQLHIVRWHR